MSLNPYATVVAHVDGFAVCEDDFGDLWVSEIPESCAELGSVIDISILQELSSLPQNTQKEILEYVKNQSKE